MAADRGDQLHRLVELVDLMLNHAFDLLPAALLIALLVSGPARLIVQLTGLA